MVKLAAIKKLMKTVEKLMKTVENDQYVGS